MKDGRYGFHTWPLTIAVGSLVGLAFALGFYNRYLHPLRRFPGPFWASVTSLHFPYLLTGKLFHVEEQALHQRYGGAIHVNS